MALSNEDKKDVSHAFGKKAAGAVSRATHDNKGYGPEYRSVSTKNGGKGYVVNHAKNKALKAKTGEKNIAKGRKDWDMNYSGGENETGWARKK